LSSTNIGSKITKKLSADLGSLLRTAGEIADGKGMELYLVGGVVRDLLLNLSIMDIDIVVVGDAFEIVKLLPLKKANIQLHNDFGTAKVKLDKWNIDFAMARSETYSRPGALPNVMPSTIENDLVRRDFTINAMAVSLKPKNFGELMDPHHGQTDLKNKTIRILHENSFVDDATRIWRAIRYEQRLDFAIEPYTLKLLERDLNMLETITGDRIRHEIELVLKEKLPEKVLHRADELKILTLLSKELAGNNWLAEKYNEARELGLTDSSLTSIYLALLFYQISDKELEQLVKRLKINNKLVRICKETLDLKNKLKVLNNPKITPSDIFFLLYEYSQPAIIANSLATDSARIEQNIDNYLTKLRHVKTRLNGDDLKKMGISAGPEIKRILHMLQAARLDGKVTTKQGESRMVYAYSDTKRNARENILN